MLSHGVLWKLGEMGGVRTQLFGYRATIMAIDGGDSMAMMLHYESKEISIHSGWSKVG